VRYAFEKGGCGHLIIGKEMNPLSERSVAVRMMLPPFFASFRLVRNRPDCAMGFPTSGNDMCGGNDMEI